MKKFEDMTLLKYLAVLLMCVTFTWALMDAYLFNNYPKAIWNLIITIWLYDAFKDYNRKDKPKTKL